MNHISKTLVRTMLTSASGVVMAAAAPAFAQEAGQNIAATDAQEAAETAQQARSGVEEIVVTAQRREERLQDVPIAVTAITAAKAEALGIDTSEGLTFSTPSLDVSRGTFNSAIFLRGVGSLNSTTGAESSIAVYVDGVYMQSQQAGVFNFNNIDRVEVLKGPQGTLFGRNATGGVINVVTRTPSTDTAVEGRVGYGNYDTFEAQAYGTTGLSDNVAIDLALYYHKQADGWGTNLNTGNEVFTNEHIGARSKMRFEAGDNTVVTLAGDYYHFQDQLGSALNVAEGSLGLDGSTNPGYYNVRSTVDDDAKSTKYGGSATIDHDFGGARLLSITAYREMSGKYVLDPDRVPGYYTHLTLTTKGRTFTQELQLQSPSGSALNWIAGLYYLHDTTTDEPNQFLFGSGGDRPTSTREFWGSTNLTSYAAFGQTTYEILPRTKLTLGLRYTIDKRNLESKLITSTFPTTGPVPTDFDDFPITPSAPVITYPAVAAPATQKKLTWRMALDHHFSDDVMLYASYNRGFRGGLYSTSSPTDPIARPEVLDAYEAGFKSDLLDRRLRLNGSAFYYDFKDLQFAVNISQGGTFRSVLFNAAKARIWGLEGEITAVPVDNLTISASASYLNGEYTYFPQGTVNVPNPATGGRGNTTLNNVDLSGRDTIRTPPFTANVSIVYDIPVEDGGFQLAGMYYHNSGFFWALDYRLKQPAYDIVNATATWTAPSGIWDVQLWVKNLLDVKYSSYTNATGAADQVSPAAPRTYGVSFGFNF